MQPMLKEPYVTPRPASRVGTSSDAAKYLRRNRGSSALWLVKRCASIDLDDDDDDDSVTARRGPPTPARRLTGDEASEIFRRSQGSIGIVLNEQNQVGYSSPRPQPRLKTSEAEANAHRKASLFQEPAKSERAASGRPRSRFLSSEAEANAERGDGTMNEVLRSAGGRRTSQLKTPSSNSGLSLRRDGTSAGADADGSTRPPRPRVRPEAEEIAHKGAGTCAAAIAGRLPGDPVCDVRVAGPGRANYEASTCGSVGTLFSNSQSTVPQSIPEGPKNEIAKHGKTGTLCFLMNSYGKLPRSPRPASRLRSEGQRYVCRNRGDNMAKCLNQPTKSHGRTRSAANRRKIA